MLFADDFVGVSGSKEGLQKLISVVHGYCNKWKLASLEEVAGLLTTWCSAAIERGHPPPGTCWMLPCIRCT